MVNMPLVVELLSRVQLFLRPHGAPPGSSVYGILKARILDFPGKNTGVGCHFFFQNMPLV